MTHSLADRARGALSIATALSTTAVARAIGFGPHAEISGRVLEGAPPISGQVSTIAWLAWSSFGIAWYFLGSIRPWAFDWVAVLSGAAGFIV